MILFMIVLFVLSRTRNDMISFKIIQFSQTRIDYKRVFVSIVMMIIITKTVASCIIVENIINTLLLLLY